MMRIPVALTMRERVCFLKVLYSFFLRDDKLTSIEEGVLSMLQKAFNIEGDQQKEFQVRFFSNVESMADEVNKIADVNARVYLLAIIKELYLIEKKSVRNFPAREREIFESTYSGLIQQVKIDQADIDPFVEISDPDNSKSSTWSGLPSIKGIKNLLGF